MIWTPQNRDGLLVADVSRPDVPPQIEEVCMTRPYIAAALALSLTAVAATRSAAQAPAQQAFWTVSYYQVDWPKVDSLTKLFKAYTLPMVEEAKKSGGLLDYKILIHSWAGRDNVVIMQKFSSFAAIHSDTSMNVALRRIVPDSTKRKAVQNAFNWTVGNGLHRDEIYAEVTKQ